jgi:hypothetical protein
MGERWNRESAEFPAAGAVIRAHTIEAARGIIVGVAAEVEDLDDVGERFGRAVERFS